MKSDFKQIQEDPYQLRFFVGGLRKPTPTIVRTCGECMFLRAFFVRTPCMRATNLIWFMYDLLGQWLNFQLLGITYLVGKIKFKLLFQGPLAKWDDAHVWCSIGTHCPLRRILDALARGLRDEQTSRYRWKKVLRGKSIRRFAWKEIMSTESVRFLFRCSFEGWFFVDYM